MPVPTYDQFIEPLLRVLAQHPDGWRHARRLMRRLRRWG